MSDFDVRRIFTFGHGQPHFPGYVVVYGQTGGHCRERMNAAYNRVWSMEYEDEEQAGVDRWALPLIDVIGGKDGIGDERRRGEAIL